MIFECGNILILICRYLSVEELQTYSGCGEHVEKKGDIVNKDTAFELSGKLIKKIFVPVSEILCNTKTNKKIINIHVPFLTFFEAKQACDKYSMGSIIGPFQVCCYLPLYFRPFKLSGPNRLGIFLQQRKFQSCCKILLCH